MALIRWNPYREMDRFFNTLYGAENENINTCWTPAVDIYEADENFVITAALPGLAQSDITVNVENNVLTISGERHLENSETKDKYSRVEQMYGSFSRSFTLPNTVDVEKIEATMAKGVLKVTLPKSEQSKARTIEVKYH